MRNTPSAGRALALAFLLSLPVAGCRTATDTRAITALVERLEEVLATTDATSRAEGLVEIFDGLDGSAAESLSERLAPNRRDLSLTVQSVVFPPLGDARVTISVLDGGTTTTMEVRAVKAGGTWKLDPSFHVKYRLDEVKAPER